MTSIYLFRVSGYSVSGIISFSYAQCELLKIAWFARGKLAVQTAEHIYLARILTSFVYPSKFSSA